MHACICVCVCIILALCICIQATHWLTVITMVTLRALDGCVYILILCSTSCLNCHHLYQMFMYHHVLLTLLCSMLHLLLPNENNAHVYMMCFMTLFAEGMALLSTCLASFSFLIYSTCMNLSKVYEIIILLAADLLSIPSEWLCFAVLQVSIMIW